jgi:hypothetical protein
MARPYGCGVPPPDNQGRGGVSAYLIGSFTAAVFVLTCRFFRSMVQLLDSAFQASILSLAYQIAFRGGWSPDKGSGNCPCLKDHSFEMSVASKCPQKQKLPFREGNSPV